MRATKLLQNTILVEPLIETPRYYGNFMLNGYSKPSNALKLICLFLTSPLWLSNAHSEPSRTSLPERIVIINANVFDHSTLAFKRNTSVVVFSGKIERLVNGHFECDTCKIIDASNKFVIPGLMDVHQHTGLGDLNKASQEANVALLRKNLYWGITTVFNPNIELDLLEKIRQAIEKDQNQFPDFYSAGSNIGPVGGWGNVSVSNVNEANKAVALMLDHKTHGIKFSQDSMAYITKNPMPTHTPEVIKAMISGAVKQKRSVFVHLSELEAAHQVIEAGANTIIHSIVDQEVTDKTIQLMKKNNVGYIATLTLYDTMIDSVRAVNGQAFYDPQRIHGKQVYLDMGSPSMNKNWRIWWDNSGSLVDKVPIIEHNLKTLVDAGITVGIGTDSATPGMILGPSLAYEMELHVKAGLMPAKVIDLATRGGAEVIGISDSVGTIQAGKRADLLILTENPIVDIRAMNSIEYVMRNGQLYDRQWLADTLATKTGEKM